MELWDYGIMGNYEIMEFWNYGIMACGIPIHSSVIPPPLRCDTLHQTTFIPQTFRLEKWDLGWNYGALVNYGIMELWNYGIMELCIPIHSSVIGRGTGTPPWGVGWVGGGHRNWKIIQSEKGHVQTHRWCFDYFL